MCGGGYQTRPDPVLHTPRYAKCIGCKEPLGEKGRGTNRWTDARRVTKGAADSGRRDDGTRDATGERCSGTEGGRGRHRPEPGSIW